MRRPRRQWSTLLAAVAALALGLSAAAEPGVETAAPSAVGPKPIPVLEEQGSQEVSTDPAYPQELDEGPHEAPSDTQPVRPQGKLQKKLQNETARLRRLEAELEALKAAPLPDGVAQANVSAAGDQESQENSPTGPMGQRTTDRRAGDHEALRIPEAPAPGAEEEFANALFALGKYDRALAVYQRIIESGPAPEKKAWARLQLGNCQRRSGDFVGALKTYADLMADSPDSFWAEEASWWSGQIKWRLLWNETLRPEVAGRPSAAELAQGG